MSAWAKLLAASSLAIGTAWDLITHPRTGGAGTVLVSDATATASDSAMAITVDSVGYAAIVDIAPLSVVVDDKAVGIFVSPGITAQINNQPITI